MALQRITERSIRALKAEAARTGKVAFAWDTDQKGFGVKASPHGACSYVVQKWIGGRGGKAQRMVIGHFPDKPLEDARRDAGKHSSKVTDGVDVITERKRNRQAIRDTINTELASTVDLFIAKKSNPDSRYWSETARLLKTQVVPVLGATMPVSGISKAAVRSLIEAKEEHHPGAARNIFAALRPFFKWCVERDLIGASPMDDLSPPDVLASRDRILTPDEIKVFWVATCNMPYPFGPFYQLLLLTAQRREEVAAMWWPEIDLGAAVWIIPKERTKNGKEHLVHLSPDALSILSFLKKAHTNGSFVFTTNGKTPISGYSKAKAKLDDLCALAAETYFPEFLPQIFHSGWRVHDLRRTAASGMAELGFQPHIVERVLNHISGAQGGLVGVYQRFEYADERKRALHAWANQIATINGASPNTNVVKLIQ